MQPSHHPDPSTILAFAARTLAPAFNIIIASHLSLCGTCRAAVRAAEALGGGLVDGLDGADVSVACRARTMALLDGATLHRFPAPPAQASDVPAPLAALLAHVPLGELPWKSKAPGVALCDVPIAGPALGALLLLRVGSGRAVPDHGHGGEEMTLVLSGAYRDHLGRFARGDVADIGEDTEHRPVAEDGPDCICLLAMEKPPRFKSVVARLLQPLIGI